MLGGDLAVLGALGWVGRGVWAGLGADLAFCVWRAGLGWAWDLAVLGVLGGWAWGLALVGGLGWVGRGFGFLCMVYIVHVFMSSWCLCVYVHVNLRCVSWGLSKTKPGIGE